MISQNSPLQIISTRIRLTHNCANKRDLADKFFISSKNEIAIELHGNKSQYQLTDNISQASNTPAITAKPPLRGVSLVCKERSFGVSIAR